MNCCKKDNACIINTAAQVASSPDRISISVNKANHTADMLGYVDDFTISVISEDADFSLFKRFGFCSGRDLEKFDGFDECIRVENGTLAVTKGTNSYISAHIDERIDLGSHILIIATITDSKTLSDTPSATYGFYHTNIKPKPQNTEKKKDPGKQYGDAVFADLNTREMNFPITTFAPSANAELMILKRSEFLMTKEYLSLSYQNKMFIFLRRILK